MEYLPRCGSIASRRSARAACSSMWLAGGGSARDGGTLKQPFLVPAHHTRLRFSVHSVKKKWSESQTAVTHARVRARDQQDPQHRAYVHAHTRAYEQHSKRRSSCTRHGRAAAPA